MLLHTWSFSGSVRYFDVIYMTFSSNVLFPVSGDPLGRGMFIYRTEDRYGVLKGTPTVYEIELFGTL